MKDFSYKFIIKLLAGPLLLFTIIYLPLEGLDPKGQLCLAVYGWVIIWWVLQPVPWAATSFLPLILFPVLGVADITATAGMYGQRVVFSMIAILLLGEAVRKSRVGERIALFLMSLPIIKNSVLRFMLIYMICAYMLGAIIAAACIPIMVPIGMATIEYIRKAYEEKGQSITTRKMSIFVALGVFYASVAGGMLLITRSHNIVAVGLMEELTGYTFNFLQWIEVGFIPGTTGVFLSFLILLMFYRPEVSVIPGGQEYFKEKRKQLGKMKLAEVNALIAIGGLITLWMLPSFIKIQWLNFYTVAVIGMLFLFILPSDLKKKEALVSAKDLMNLNWNVVWLVAGGVGLASMASKLGVMAWVSSLLSGMSATVFVVLSGLGTAILTNFLSGTATVTMVSTIMFGIATDIGVHPGIIARIIPAAATGVIFPWAGLAAGIAFATGHLTIGEMAKTGVIFTFMLLIVISLGSLVLVPLFVPLP